MSFIFTVGFFLSYMIIPEKVTSLVSKIHLANELTLTPLGFWIIGFIICLLIDNLLN